jgi:hypothetical protein
MTVEEQLRALCDHLDAQQAPITSMEIIGERGFETFSGATEARHGGRRLAVVLAAAAVVVIVIAGWLSTSGNDAVEIVPADRPTSSTFVSPRNGFSVTYADSGESTVTPATQLWGWSDGFDVIDTGSDAVFTGASTTIEFPDGSIDSRVDDFLSQDRDGLLPDGCGVPRSQQAEITIDRQPARIAECPNYIEATVLTGGRLYLFTLTHDRSDARDLFDAFASTIDLTPETAVDFPALTTTFVSPTYGYSFGYLDRGGLSAATELWDPVNPPDDIDVGRGFDAVETGLGAYFEAASMPLPAAFPADWWDEYITPTAAGGCGVPRSEQQETTMIDGHTGRIAQCPNQIEATVIVGDRLYLFRLQHGARPDAREFFDAWIATIDLSPETPDGTPVAVWHSEFGDTLTFTAPPLTGRGDGLIEIALTASQYGRVIIAPDPVPSSVTREDCLELAIGQIAPRAEDSTALARNIGAEPDFEATDTVPVSIAGTEGLQMDVTFTEHDLCYELWSPSRKGSGTPWLEALPEVEWKMRLYLVDIPQSVWPSDLISKPRVLSVAVIAPENDFDAVLERAAPIVDSIEFKEV